MLLLLLAFLLQNTKDFNSFLVKIVCNWLNFENIGNNNGTFGAKIRVRTIEVSAINKNRSAVVAVLSAKSSFSAKTVSVKPSF